MRNARWILLIGALLAGCASNAASDKRKELQAGYQALGQNDYESAMSHAEQFLRNNPNGGAGTPEALYLQGRVYEQRAVSADTVGNTPEAHSDLQDARETYEHALTLNPTPQLAALLHAGTANVAYFEDDYPLAMREWALSYNGLRQADAKAWVLYRIGLCQQRLGWFDQADRSFAQVRQQFPDKEPAQRAAAHEGAHGFYVQVGAYGNPANADKVARWLQSQGLPAAKSTEPTGRQAVRVGPTRTYAEAKVIKARLIAAYPTAMIEP